jgi:hypothetical protein
MIKFYLPFVLCLCVSSTVWSQQKDTLLKVHLDRASPLYNFCITEIQFVDFVVDRHLADVQVQWLTEPTANGSQRVRLFFFGYGRFEGQNDTLAYYYEPTEAFGGILEKGLQTFKSGLLPYLLQTDWITRIDYTITAPQQTLADDVWGAWTILVSGDVDVFNRHQVNKQVDPDNITDLKSKELRTDFGVKAWKITPRHRFTAQAYMEHHQSSRYIFDSLIYKEANQSLLINSHIVEAISEHYSIGFGMRTYRSENSNEQVSSFTSLLFGAEYSFLPYSMFFRKQLFVSGYVSAGHSKDEITPSRFSWQMTALLNYAEIFKSGFINGGLSTGYRPSDDNAAHAYITMELNAGFNLRKNLFWVFTVKNGTYKYRSNINKKSNSNWQNNSSIQTGLAYYFGSGYRNIINPRMTNLL